MKLIIDIPEECYEIIKHSVTQGYEYHEPYLAIAHGFSLDDVKAVIGELDGKYVIGDYGTYGENGPKYVRLWEVLQILDNIGKADMRGNANAER